MELYPAKVSAQDFAFANGQLVAVITDLDGAHRHSLSYRHDRMGRVTHTYAYHGGVGPDSLRQVSSETQYGLSGRVEGVVKRPYGTHTGADGRVVHERYDYDRQGRVSHIYASVEGQAESVLAEYDYYPSGKARRVLLGGGAVELAFTYHIGGSLRSVIAKDVIQNKEIYAQDLFYEDCDVQGCVGQYSGNVSRMAQDMVAGSGRDTRYFYDLLNRLVSADDAVQDAFDETFGYDPQGRIVWQRRGGYTLNSAGGEYAYYAGNNQLSQVKKGVSVDVDSVRDMSSAYNFVYDDNGNLVEDKSKHLTMRYDYRNLPLESVREVDGANGTKDSVRVQYHYDSYGNRVTKRYDRKAAGGAWELVEATHYTGLGSEIRENGSGGVKVVVNMPNGLGRYAVTDAQKTSATGGSAFEWYLKNHLGSTMLVYGTGTQGGAVKAAYDYRAFGAQVSLAEASDKVTEAFTGKELDAETGLNYFGARYYDGDIGLWVGVDPMRQFASPYLYAGNNPVRMVDPDGRESTVLQDPLLVVRLTICLY